MSSAVGKFHQQLFGRRAYPLNNRYLDVYSKFENEGMKGVRFPEAGVRDQVLFTAVLVCGLYQTIGQKDVLFFAPPSLEIWANDQMDHVIRTMARVRKEAGMPRGEIDNVLVCFSHLGLQLRPFHFVVEPKHWVAYGLTEAPGWADPHLIQY